MFLSLENIDPRSECWHENMPCEHMAHISDRNPNLAQLASLGNHLSDKINWLFEVIGKISLAQAEIANKLSLRVDLIDNTLSKIDDKVPVNFGDAFAQLYEESVSSKIAQDKILQHVENLSREMQNISLKIAAIEKATGADLNIS